MKNKVGIHLTIKVTLLVKYKRVHILDEIHRYVTCSNAVILHWESGATIAFTFWCNLTQPDSLSHLYIWQHNNNSFCLSVCWHCVVDMKAQLTWAVNVTAHTVWLSTKKCDQNRKHSWVWDRALGLFLIWSVCVTCSDTQGSALCWNVLES